MQNLLEGIYLDTYHVALEFGFDYKQCTDLFTSFNIDFIDTRPEYIEIHSELLDLGHVSRIVLSFCNNRISKISITPQNGNYSIQTMFPKVHAKLAKALGAPQRRIAWQFFFYPVFFSPFIWENDRVRITHTIEDRFGQYDVITILIRGSS